jgi:outer membrane protein TolC
MPDLTRRPPRHGVEPAIATAYTPILAAGLVIACASGCTSSMDRIDARAESLVREVSAELGPDASPPRWDRDPYREGDALSYRGSELYRPPTENPAAAEITFVERTAERQAAIDAEAAESLLRLGAPTNEEGAAAFDLRATLAFALRHAREYKSAEEDYILSALRLLVERHLWGPRFFNDVSAVVSGDAEDASFNSALRVVNELGVSQRLPYGGEVSARLLAQATEQLRSRVAGGDENDVQDAEIILAANLPILRGAGLAANNSRIQAERNLIYAARDFEQFRREFLVDIARDFLNLVVQQRNIENSETRLLRLIEFQDRAKALVVSGRSAQFEASLADQDVLFAQDNLRSQRESYALALDRFKVRLGMPVETNLVIVPSTLGLPTPETDVDDAVRRALAWRLDLQTERDALDDARRDVDVAANDLLPDLDLSTSVSVPTDADRARSGLRFNTEDSAFSAALTFSVPLDREIERLQLRQAQIALERSIRAYEQFRDGLIIEVRDAVREIDRALFSIRIQEENIRVAELRLESIEAAPDRATARDRSEAADGLTEAQDEYEGARRDLEVAILEYLVATGSLRVDGSGRVIPLAGMAIGLADPEQDQDPNTGAENPAGAGGGGG